MATAAKIRILETLLAEQLDRCLIYSRKRRSHCATICTTAISQLSSQSSYDTPLKVFFAGIDGSGKTTCMNLLISRLEPKLRILKVANLDSYVAFKGQTTPVISNRWRSIMESLRVFSHKYYLHGFFLIFNFLYKRLLAKRVSANVDVIVYETDSLLHPAVYITHHFPWIRTLLAPKFRQGIVSALFRPRNNFVIFYLDIDPQVAVERIEKRGQPAAPHENRADLEILRTEFEQILGFAENKALPIVRLNAHHQDPATLVEQMHNVLKTKSSLVRNAFHE